MLVRRDFLKKSSWLVAAGFSGISLFASERKKTQKTSSFRISLNTSTIEPYKLPVTKQVELCAEAGFDGIELWISDIQQYLSQGGGNINLSRTYSIIRVEIGKYDWLCCMGF